MSKKRNAHIAVGVLMAASVAMPAVSHALVVGPTTLDFETITSMQDGTTGTVAANTQYDPGAGVGIINKGFTYTPGPQVGTDSNDLHVANAVYGTYGVGYAEYPYNGTTIVGAHHSAILARADGGAFNLSQFDYAGFNQEVSTGVFQVDEAPVTVTGTYQNGGTVTKTFTPDGIVDGKGGQADFQTFFIGETPWTDLTSVTFSTIDPSSVTQGAFAVDNIVVSPVPLPASLFLFSGGALALSWLGRKSRNRA